MLAARAHLPAEPRTAAHLVVTGPPPVRQQRATFVEHLQGQPVAGAEAHAPGHAGLLAPLAVGGPLRGQIEADIDEGVLLARGVAEEDADLAVLDLAQPAAPLP